MLEFYFRFAIWSYLFLWDDHVYNPTKLRQEVSFKAEVISFYQKFNMASATILDL